jgi:hypothetical protein
LRVRWWSMPKAASSPVNIHTQSATRGSHFSPSALSHCCCRPASKPS